MRLGNKRARNESRETRSHIAEIATGRILQYLNAGLADSLPTFRRVEDFIELVNLGDRLREQLKSLTQHWAMDSLIKRDGRVIYEPDAPMYLCRYRFRGTTISKPRRISTTRCYGHSMKLLRTIAGLPW